MEFALINTAAGKYATITSGQIQTEEDGRDLVAACFEYGVNSILLPEASLSQNFLWLSTSLLGLVIQKLANYKIRAAAVLSKADLSDNFKDFILETNRGNLFHIYDNPSDAEAWLLSDSGSLSLLTDSQ